MFRMTILWGQVLMFICRFVLYYVSWHNTIFTGSLSIQKGNVISGCFMSECYGGVNIVGMVKETIEVFFWLGPLHVNVVCETKPGKWLVGCRLYDYANIFMGKFEKLIGGTKILSFIKVFNSLSLCFVCLVLFYKPF
jgi:hypothetical protein